MALVALAVAVAQLGYEFTVPSYGPARDAGRDDVLPLLLRWGGAGVFTVATLLLLLGLRHDRQLLDLGTDRHAGNWWVAGLLTVVAGAVVGAPVAMLVGLGVVVATTQLRSAGTDLGRQVIRLAFLITAAHVFSVMVRFLAATWLRWQVGFPPDDQLDRLRETHHVYLVQDVAVGLSALTMLALPVLLWRRRDQVPAHRRRLTEVCLALAVVAYFGVDPVGAAVAVVCLVGVRVHRRGETVRTIAPQQDVFGPTWVPDLGEVVLESRADPLLWFPGPTRALPAEQWLPAAREFVELTVPGAEGRSDEVADQLADSLAPAPARATDLDLPWLFLHWRDARRAPVAVRLGVARRTEGDAFAAWSSEHGERPVVEQLPDGAGRRVTTHLREEGADVYELRYVVEAGHPDLVVVALSRSRSTALFGLAAHLDRLAGTFRLHVTEAAEQ